MNNNCGYLNSHRQDDLDGMEAQTGCNIYIQVCMVHHMEAP